jgi:hypothetical protein
MPLDWLNKGLVGAAVWAVESAQNPIIEGRAIELTN